MNNRGTYLSGGTSLAGVAVQHMPGPPQLKNCHNCHAPRFAP